MRYLIDYLTDLVIFIFPFLPPSVWWVVLFIVYGSIFWVGFYIGRRAVIKGWFINKS